MDRRNLSYVFAAMPPLAFALVLGLTGCGSESAPSLEAPALPSQQAAASEAPPPAEPPPAAATPVVQTPPTPAAPIVVGHGEVAATLKAMAKDHPTTRTSLLVYLASYRTAAGADRGWQTLRKISPPLVKLEAAQRDVDLGAKGKFVRLFAKTAKAGQAQNVCRDLMTLLPDCGAKGRD